MTQEQIRENIKKAIAILSAIDLELELANKNESATSKQPRFNITEKDVKKELDIYKIQADDKLIKDILKESKKKDLDITELDKVLMNVSEKDKKDKIRNIAPYLLASIRNN